MRDLAFARENIYHLVEAARLIGTGQRGSWPFLTCAVAALHGSFCRNVWTAAPTGKVKEVAAMLKAIEAQEDRAAAQQKTEQAATNLKEMKLADAVAPLSRGIEGTLHCYAFPREHWRCLSTNNPLEKILHEARQRTRTVRAFPDRKSALMPATALLRHAAGTIWATRR